MTEQSNSDIHTIAPGATVSFVPKLHTIIDSLKYFHCNDVILKLDRSILEDLEWLKDELIRKHKNENNKVDRSDRFRPNLRYLRMIPYFKRMVKVFIQIKKTDIFVDENEEEDTILYNCIMADFFDSVDSTDATITSDNFILYMKHPEFIFDQPILHHRNDFSISEALNIWRKFEYIYHFVINRLEEIEFDISCNLDTIDHSDMNESHDGPLNT